MSAPSFADRELVRTLFDFLEDRGVLYEAYDAEVKEWATSSILEIRKFLTDELLTARPGPELAQVIREIRGACRQALHRVSDTSQNSRIDMRERAAQLGELRARVGDGVYMLSDLFGVEVVGNLQKLKPPDPG